MPGEIQSPRVGQDAVDFDQQHDVAALDYCCVVQKPLAGRIVLQMDQAAPAHQAISGHQRERGQDTNLVRRIDLVLIAIVKKELHLDASLYTCLQIFPVSIFEKTQLSCALQPDRLGE
jgi:hypothetical protein